MSGRELPEYVEALLRKVVSEIGFNKYSVSVNQGSEHGDGFASEILNITITEQSIEKELIVLIKIAPLNKAHREVFSLDSAFKREAFFYNDLMPAFVQFQEEKHLSEKDQFRAYPKGYAAVADDDSEQFAILMEDLRPQHFRMWDKSKPASLENLRLLFCELGKFHGISIAMKDQTPEKFAKFKQVKDFRRKLYRSDNMRGMCNAMFDRAIKSLKNEDHKIIMGDVKRNFIPYLDNCLDDDASDRFGVICHGDFWNNNILQRFNELSVTQDLRFVDWQGIMYASPAIDLLYNIFSSTDKKHRDSDFNNLLMWYYQSLSRMVKLLGSNPDNLFTFSDLKTELKRCGTFCLLVAPMLVQILHADSSETPDFDEMFDKMSKGESNQEFVTGFSKNGQLEYDERINGVVQDIIEFEYYQKID